IREDVSMNLAAVEGLVGAFPGLDLVFVESGGDNLAATFSPELADAHIYVIDVAEGDKIPRKGGPGITRSDLLVINKIDLAPYVGASLEVMERDARRMRGARPFVFTGIVQGDRLETEIVLGPGARGVASTPAATKVYRMDASYAAERSRYVLRGGAVLECLPDQTIPFAGARFFRSTRADLDPDSTLILW